MRFEPERKPAPYLNRRDQYRLLGLIALLVMVMAGMRYVARPEAWAWFFNLQQVAPPEEELKPLDLDGIDFRVRTEPNDPLPLDTVVLANEQTPANAAPAANNLRQFPAELLGQLKDQQLGLLRSEEPGILALIEHVQKTPAAELHAAADNEVGYRAVNVDPQAFRGRLIALRGVLRRYEPFAQLRTSDEETSLFQGWLFTDDSANNPWFIICAAPNDNLNEAERMDVPVEVAGYFVKRYGYATEMGAHTAPMVVAQTFRQLNSPQPVQQPASHVAKYLFGFFTLLAALFGLVIWRFRVSDRKFASGHLAEIADSRLDPSSESIAALNSLQNAEQEPLFPSQDAPPAE